MCNSNSVGVRLRLFLLLAGLLTFLVVGNASAMNRDTGTASKSITAKRTSKDPYCGVSCLYTVMKLSGSEFDFRSLLKPAYIGSYRGSSLSELEKAADDYGLYSISVFNMTSEDLGRLEHPAILHLKFDMTSMRYDHFELFLGTENGKAKLFDPPNPAKLVSFRELAPRWGGKGLIVSAKPIDHSTVFGPPRKRLMIYGLAAIIAILSIRQVRRFIQETMLGSQNKALGLSMVQGAALAIIALLCGMLYHFANDEGLLANANATTLIQQAHLANFIPKIGERKAYKLLNDKAVFIDARFARDYKVGHLEGAISVPVDANDVERRKATTEIPKDADIVLYCQSSKCKFAEIVAVKLIEDGYSNISIFRGGWTEWVAKNRRPREAAI